MISRTKGPPNRVTDIGKVVLPFALLEHLRCGNRDRVVNQTVDIMPGWWNDHLNRRGLAGGPVLARSVEQSGLDGGLSRSDVYSHAGDASADPVGALRLLWYSLAWGAGHRVRLCDQRLKSIQSMGGEVAGELLRRAAERSRTDAYGAYEMLAPGGKPAIANLGAAFLTKFLYFAGGGTADHPCLILDSRVAYALHHNGWTSLPEAGRRWPAATYQRYLDLVRLWAAKGAAELDREVANDEIEFWLFLQGNSAKPDE
jgi:hypothetical protein